jgi:hypothetical protein
MELKKVDRIPIVMRVVAPFLGAWDHAAGSTAVIS